MINQNIPLNFRLFLFLYRHQNLLTFLLIIFWLIIRFDLTFLILAAEPQQDYDYLQWFPEEEEEEEQDEPWVPEPFRSDIYSDLTSSSSDDDFDNVILDKYQHRLRVSRIRDLIEKSSDEYEDLIIIQDLLRIAKNTSQENNALDPFSGNYPESLPYTPTASFLHKCLFFFFCVLLSLVFGGLVQGYLLPLGYSMDLIAYRLAIHQSLSEIEHNREAIWILFNLLNKSGLVFYDGENIPMEEFMQD